MDILQWFVPDPPIRLRWIVPADAAPLRAPAALQSLPVIIGPVGEAGPQGVPGPLFNIDSLPLAPAF